MSLLKFFCSSLYNGYNCWLTLGINGSCGLLCFPRAYLESEVAISEELVQKYSNSALGHVNSTIKELRRLFLVDDLVDSLKVSLFYFSL